MKFAHLLEMNMVPEWRNQYIDYKRLDDALSKALDTQKERYRTASSTGQHSSHELRDQNRGIDSYFQLIKANQKFANYFQQECEAQLKKINHFHREKLHEMKGKYNNLQDQLEQVLSSAIYKELSLHHQKSSPSHHIIQSKRDRFLRRTTSPTATPTSTPKITKLNGWIKKQTRNTEDENNNENDDNSRANSSPIGASSPTRSATIGQQNAWSEMLKSLKFRLRKSLLSRAHEQASGPSVLQRCNMMLDDENGQIPSGNDTTQPMTPISICSTEPNDLPPALGTNTSNEHPSAKNLQIIKTSSPIQDHTHTQNQNPELGKEDIQAISRKLSASLVRCPKLMFELQNNYSNLKSNNNNNKHPNELNNNDDCNDNANPELHNNNSPSEVEISSPGVRFGACKKRGGTAASSLSGSSFHSIRSLNIDHLLMAHNHNHHHSLSTNNNNNNNNNYNNINHQQPESSILLNNNAQSRKKILAFHRKKISNLRFAFQELYLNLVLFEQYTQLNYAAFEQLLRKHDRMFASSLGRKFYQEFVQTADFYNDLSLIDHLIESVEHIYTLNFEDGNRRKAIEKLSVPANVYKPSSPMLDFRVGFELGCSAVLFLLVLFVGFWLNDNTNYDWRTVFRLYRSPLILIIFLFQTGISLVIWKHFKINHVLIFELNPRNKLSFQHFLEFASILAIIWSISVLIFLFSEQLHLPPALCPLVVVLLVGLYLFNPMSFWHHKARFWLLRIIARIFTAPLNPVRFADFWIADQLVSIVPLFLDLEYLSCFYMSNDEVLSISHLGPIFANRCVTRNPQDLVIRTIVAALPAWFRCAQCLRRWRDENVRLHLANAGKYACMVMTVILSSVAQYNSQTFEFDTMRCIWLGVAIFTSSLTAYWDTIYDFGLFNTYDSQPNNNGNNLNNNTQQQRHSSINSSSISFNMDFEDGEDHTFNDSTGVRNNDDSNRIRSRTNSNSTNRDSLSSDTTYSGLFNERTKKTKTYPFLRKELVYPVWVYYFAIIENWILRFGWIFTISLTEFSNIEAGLVVSLLAPLEMFRRFVWNCIRLENEQLNNCGLFRAVRDIPIEVVAPIDESQLDKVIMMMDSRDGPSVRSRLMKRRALRPDSVSFMVLHTQDDDNDDEPTDLDVSLSPSR